MDIIVLVSADIEWQAVCQLLSPESIGETPFGDIIYQTFSINNQERRLIMLNGGWGKISAAASTQYAIDRWRPKLLVNLGTCGGFDGEIERGDIVLVERTLVYDIFDQMGDTESHISHYTTEIDLSWLEEPYPAKVKRGLLISGDRDLVPGDIYELKEKYGAVAGDWESGAIAFVAHRNQTPCLILRGVSDLVGEQGGEAYEDISIFEESALEIMSQLLDILPDWIAISNVFN